MLCYVQFVKYSWLGLSDYNSIFELQKQSLHWSQDKEEVWGLEHPHVISLGKRSKIENELKSSAYQRQFHSPLQSSIDSQSLSLSQAQLLPLPQPSHLSKSMQPQMPPQMSPQMSPQIPVVKSDRGGLATLHSPGQLIIYPLISIDKRGWGPKNYVCQLLKITEGCLLKLGLHVQCDEDSSGLYINQKKICFIGLRVSDGRVYHGLSLNVSNDLSLFEDISACGWHGRPLTSLKEQGITTLSTKELFSLWQHYAMEQKCF